MSGTQQKAIAITELKKPVVNIQRPVPSPQQGEVLIKVKAAHLLPHDSYMRDLGLFVGDKLPWVLGGDVAGTIEEIGPSTSTTFKIGDRVTGICVPVDSNTPDSAAAQEYCILKVDGMAKVPDSYKKEDAVTIPLNLITTFMALFTEDYGFAWPPPWEKSTTTFDPTAQTLIIVGAGSNCGKFAIQFSKLVGIGRIIAIAGPSNEAELKKLGATHFIDRHALPEAIKSQIHAIVPKDDITAVYDCYNWTFELGLSLISSSKPARLAVLHRVDGAEIAKTYPNVRAGTVRCSNENLGPHKGEFWRQLPGWLERSEILPAEWKVVGGLEAVEEVNAVLDDYRDGKGGAQGLVLP
ncbi:hypothetical protein M409DRAFT_19362 [Zasmidium cellare ATCC 36951]|uniref:Alcohol dehydrogenase-like N-terminal domain-containing protein n=1 Tax=Zasmidium cellare ATCC 36951 TaxID=1080233 RepID=A0A6A6CXF9_ZASCE|nr:uncharacterized protein M409DRAFT_19362 [Zasmidium cellare ATCC 36951]KAF2170542.1 hypothetical protein M409DRAFT_19362 [Zasmidium cellare ATCC 36951]